MDKKIDSIQNFISLINQQYGVTLQEEIVLEELQIILQEKVAKVVRAQYEKHTIEALCELIGDYFIQEDKKADDAESQKAFNEAYDAQVKAEAKPKKTRKPKTLN
jgi:hypothetical protein